MNEKNNQNQNPNQEKKKNKWIMPTILGVLIIIIIILLLRGCGVGGPGGVEKPNEENTNIHIGGGGLTIDPSAGDYVEPEKQGPAKGVAIPGWGTITIPVNKTEVTVDFYNPVANKDLYYLTFELRLPDDSEQGYEVLYKSGLVEPDKHIQKITLSRGLEAGTYEATIHVQPYKMDEYQTPTNNADMQTTIIVK